MFVIEAAIDHAAKSLGIDASVIQRKNMMDDGNEMPYGQIIKNSEAKNCWDEAISKYDIEEIKKRSDAFNAKNDLIKKGMAVMPVCFGISFTNTMMNHARALVHVYSDGTVGVSTGAVEMGQGVNSKMIQVAAKTLGISTEKIKLETTNTTRVANTSPSAASSTADLNGKALLHACNQINERLHSFIKTEVASNLECIVEIKDERVYINDEATVYNWKNLIRRYS